MTTESAVAELPAPDQTAAPEAPPSPSTKILAIDIGGTKVKILASGETEPRKATSGKRFTPAKMVDVVKDLSKGWEYDVVSIGYPGLVGDHGPRSEPGNLGAGWVGFNFAAAFDKPVRIINDAALQALGSYEGGRMLFLGLGTGLGSTLIVENVIIPLELGQLLHTDGGRLGAALSRRGFERLGKHAWRAAVRDVVAALTDAFIADYIVIGGGNAKRVKEMPPGTRRGHNLTAFRGGFRLWTMVDVPTLSADQMATSGAPTGWRVI